MGTRLSHHPSALASVGARGGVLGSSVTVSQLPQPPATPILGRSGAWRGRRRLAAGDLGALAGPPRRGWIWVLGRPALPASRHAPLLAAAGSTRTWPWGTKGSQGAPELQLR